MISNCLNCKGYIGSVGHGGIISENMPSRLRGFSPEPGFFSCEFLDKSLAFVPKLVRKMDHRSGRLVVWVHQWSNDLPSNMAVCK